MSTSTGSFHNADRPKSRTQTPLKATNATGLRERLEAQQLPKAEEAVPAHDDLFTVMNVSHDCPVKDDMSSMEHPIFAISKKPSMEIRRYSRSENTLTVIPSSVGAPDFRQGPDDLPCQPDCESRE